MSMYQKYRAWIGQKRIIFMGGILLGCLIFIMTYGWAVLDVTYDAWLLNGGDISQNYIGWQYYRQTPWQFPFGIIEGLTHPTKVSVVYTDSITFFALFFKLLSPFLPSTFQYFGLWGIISFGLMGGCSSLLIRKYTDNGSLCLLSSIFFIISPYVLQRMFAHTSLGGQWIIIIAIMAWLHNWGGENIGKRTVIWCALLGLAAMIHIYFVPMVVIFLVCSCINAFLCSKKLLRSFLQFLIPVSFTLLLLFSMGAFWGNGEMSSDGLGVFSANLNFLINPIWGTSKLFIDRPCGLGQYEGMGYLGGGIILLSFLSLFILISNKGNFQGARFYKNINIRLGISACLIFLILALSPTIMCGEEILIEIPWPDFIIDLLSIFRSSGRFVWPICYLIMLMAIAILLTNEKHTNMIYIILALTVSLQIYDLSGVMHEKSIRFSDKEEYRSAIDTSLWEAISDEKQQIVFLPYDLVFDNADATFSVSEFAFHHNITLNSFYVSRINTDVICPITNVLIEELNNGTVRDDILYILSAEQAFYFWQNDCPLHIYFLDNMYVGVKERNPFLDQSSDVVYLSSSFPWKIPLEEMIVLASDDTAAIQGKTISPNGVMGGPGYNISAGKYIVEIEGYHLENIGLLFTSNDEQLQIKSNLKANTDTFVKCEIMITDDCNEFQIWVFNSTPENRIISSVSLNKSTGTQGE